MVWYGMYASMYVCMYVCMYSMRLVVFLAVVMRCSNTGSKKHALKNQSPRVVCVQVLFSVKCLRVKCFAGQSLANWFAGFSLSDLLKFKQAGGGAGEGAAPPPQKKEV